MIQNTIFPNLNQFFLLFLFFFAFVPKQATAQELSELDIPFEVEMFTETYEEFEDGEPLSVWAWGDLAPYDYNCTYLLGLSEFEFSLLGDEVSTLSCENPHSHYQINHAGIINFSSLDLLIHPYVGLLADRGLANSENDEQLSEISTKIVEGENGRILKVQYKNWGFYNDIMEDFISEDYVNFQVWLYEEDNMIEIHYGSSNITQPELDFGNGQWNWQGTSYEDNCSLPGCMFGPIYTNHLDYQFYVMIGGTIGDPKITPLLEYVDEEPGPALELLLPNEYSANLTEDEINDWMFEEIIPEGTVLRLFNFWSTYTSIEELEIEQINAFPNPCQDFIQINIPNKGEKITIEIFDLEGAMVEQIQGGNPVDKIKVSELPEGLYLLKINTEEKQYTSKFLKK